MWSFSKTIPGSPKKQNVSGKHYQKGSKFYWIISVNELVENVQRNICIEFEGNVSIIVVASGIYENIIKFL